MNVLNVADVEREFRRCASYARHQAAREWVVSVARNYFLGHLSAKDCQSNFVVYDPLIKRHALHVEMPPAQRLSAWAKEALGRGETLHWFDPVQVRRRNFWQAVEQIVHWFNNWPADDRRWHRLTRINFDTAAGSAAMFMADVQSNLWDYVKDCPPVKFKMECGFHWVQMVTPLHFERESRMMNHCVGNGAYYSQHQRGTSAYYSLRDAHNKPHVTLEVGLRDDGNGCNRVTQCKGRQNARPIDVYQPFIWPFIKHQGWTIMGDKHNIDMPADVALSLKGEQEWS